MSDYAVIQTRFEPIDMDVLVRVLSQSGGIADASRIARLSEWNSVEHFSQEQANTVCDELTKRDIGVRVVTSAELPHLPEPRTIRWFELDPREFRIP